MNLEVKHYYYMGNCDDYGLTGEDFRDGKGPQTPGKNNTEKAAIFLQSLAFTRHSWNNIYPCRHYSPLLLIRLLPRASQDSFLPNATSEACHLACDRRAGEANVEKH